MIWWQLPGNTPSRVGQRTMLLRTKYQQRTPAPGLLQPVEVGNQLLEAGLALGVLDYPAAGQAGQELLTVASRVGGLAVAGAAASHAKT